MGTDGYISPLSERYASKEMQHIFSQDKKFQTWRKLWIALAETEMELGLSKDGEPVITQEMIDELKAHQEEISSQMLLSPVTVRMDPAAAAELLTNRELLTELGFEIEEFGEGTVLLRQIPMDLSPDLAAEAAEALARDLMRGRREEKNKVRDDILHTVACKAAI